jgi:tRNA-splicing ligase RtcB (3'-phosphate/5'-hydroxy nucleic acid ligase)
MVGRRAERTSLAPPNRPDPSLTLGVTDSIMPIARVLSDAGHPVKIWTDDVEPEAERQLRNIAKLPFIFKHVAVMPDVHFGKGATVGSVIATRNAIIPAAVGVDIGCGMAAVPTDLTSSDFGGGDVAALRHTIERSVPVGFNSHNAPRNAALEWAREQKESRGKVTPQKALNQLGTLGGGNHFVELCTDERDRVWIVLHSGSRNLGKTLAEQHIKTAQKLAERFFVDLPDVDLAYLPVGTPEFKAYIDDLKFAQDYAFENRREMLAAIVDDVRCFFGRKGREVSFEEPINCHHNYVAWEQHFGEEVIVTRKGAIRARAGDLGIIPGSMGTRSYIVEGLGNEESFSSCSHGAGRRMSRARARKEFTAADLAAQTAGVECRKDAGVIDEIPGAYKDIDRVMEQQRDLVQVRHTLKQFVCVKG